MTQYFYSNTSSIAQTAGGINASAPGVTLSNFSGFPTSYPFWAILDRGTVKAEIVIVTSVAGSVATITRGQDGTLASDHNAGATFEHIIPASLANRAEAHMEATTGVHGVSGSLVGTTGAQTVTGKSYRGGYRHLYSEDVTALAAGFEVDASSALARDGFKHTNTAGDVDRRGFLLTQSGTDRFEAFNDGSLRVTPNSGSTRPGVEARATAAKSALRVGNASAANANTFNVAGNGDTTIGGTATVTGTLTASGNATVGGTLGVTGTSTLAGVNAGAVSATTLGASGAASLGSTLAVTGTATLTGDVTLPLPAASTTPRLVVNGRTGSQLWNGKNQAGTVTSLIKETGEAAFAATVFGYNSTSALLPSVPNTAAVAAPVSGMVIFDQSDRLWKQHNGSAFVVIGGTNIATTGHVEYVRTTTQSIANATMVKANFTTAVQTDTAIVTVASGTDFTLVRAGVYYIKANVPWASSDGTGTRWAVIGKASDSSVRYSTVNLSGEGGGAKHLEVSTMHRFAAADVVSIFGFQDKTSGALNLDPQTATGPMTLEIHWMGP